jgi:hypothetical protein
MIWFDNDGKTEPYKYRALLAYCPKWSDTEYEIVKWNGEFFYGENIDDEIDQYVVKWAAFLEAD